MGKRPVGAVLSYLRTAAAPLEAAADQELLRHFRDERHEPAFAELVRRHGPMVLGVCRRLLGSLHDAEDAFQATFLVLAKKAGALGSEKVLAHWLHAVAYRTALHARGERARRQSRERQEVLMTTVDPFAELEWRDLRAVLDEEVRRLPDKYRIPVVLCYLQGHSYDEAARQLGCPKGTLAARLARARARLQTALAGRGVTLSAAGLATLLADSATAAVPVALAGDTVRAALATAAGHAAAVPVRAAALAATVLKGAAWGKGALAVILVLLLGVTVAGALAGQTGAQDLPPDGRAEVAPSRAQPQEPGPQPKKVPQPEPLLKRYKYKDLHVEAGFTPVKTEVVLGEPLPVTFSVKNLGRKEIGYWFGGDYRGTGRHDRFKIEVRDASDKLLRDPKADANGRIHDLGGITGVHQVKPGETKTYVVELTDFRTFAQPGEHVVTCRFGIDLGDLQLGGREERAFVVATRFRIKLLPRTPENVGRILRQLLDQARASQGTTLTKSLEVACSFADRRVLPDLVAMAATGDSEHRRAALGALGRFRAPEAVGAALKGLRDSEDSVRAAAVAALGEMKTQEAVEGLLQRLPVEKPAGIAAVLTALGRTGSPRALAPLLKALDAPEEVSARGAISGLAALGGKEALAALRRCAAKGELGRRVPAAEALVTTLRQPFEPHWLFPVIRVGKTFPHGGRPAHDAIHLIRWHGGERAIPALIHCLDLKDPAPRAHMASWIFNYRQQQAGWPNVAWHYDPKTPQQLDENRKTLRQLRAWLVERAGGGKAPRDPAPAPALPKEPPKMTGRVAELLKILTAKKFSDREAAGRGLVALGDEAVPALRWAAAWGEDLETRRRAQTLVEAVGRRWEIRSFLGHAGPVASAGFARDGKRALSCGKDGVRVWDAASGKEVSRLGLPTVPVHALAFSPDGKQVLGAGGDGLARLWDLSSGSEAASLKGHAGAVTAGVVCPDGRRAVTGGDDATVRLWDLKTGAEVRRFLGHTDAVSGLAVTPDGRRALSAGLDGTLRLWDLDSGKQVRVLRGHREAVHAVALLPGGRALSAGADRALRLWDLQTGAELRRLTGHTDSVYGVAVPRDGRRAVSCGHDGTARLWDLETAREVRRFPLRSDYADSVAVAPDGRLALVALSDGTVRLLKLGE
jgi:RNA polymerase sigma factor (sigma-70 family)